LHFTLFNGLSLVVSEATRGNNILDVVISNDPLIVGCTEILPPFSNSDQSSVAFNISVDNDVSHVSNDGNNCKKLYEWSNADYEAISQHLAAIDWYKMLTVNLEVDSIWNAFCDILNTAIDNSVPLEKNLPIEAKFAKPKIRYPPGIQRAIARKR